MRRSNKSIYGSPPPQQTEEFDETAIDDITRPLIAYNRRLANILHQMINDQGANYDKNIVMDRLKLLRSELEGIPKG